MNKKEKRKVEEKEEESSKEEKAWMMLQHWRRGRPPRGASCGMHDDAASSRLRPLRSTLCSHLAYDEPARGRILPLHNINDGYRVNCATGEAPHLEVAEKVFSFSSLSIDSNGRSQKYVHERVVSRGSE